MDSKNENSFWSVQGLEYLHEKANPPVIYRDLKSSSILLDEEFNPRLSDYGLAKLGLGGNKMHVSPRVMGSYGYCASEYERTGGTFGNFQKTSMLLVPNQPSQVEISSAPKNDHNHEEEKDTVEPEEEHNNDSDYSSDGDGDGDHDDPFGLKSSDSDDGGSVEDQQEQDNSEKNQAQVKKSVKWASTCKSKGDCKDGSAHSIARHNSNTKSHVESPDQNLNSNSSLTRGSGSDSKTSNSESEDGRSSNYSWSNRGMGLKYGSYGSSSREDSDVGSQDGSMAFGVRSYINVDSQDGSVGLSSRCDSNAESHFGFKG
ncbi:hypothetical protein RHGRI_014822 [Rhododendron griersonianum]|uniref:Protein kinase domain-containing protein n=1 Tax=Rhododendron griersonianum TaxID=479676 RepID=A0AAV6KAW4_9ERIC|nr:hypothetical protein RHGRI_014822 [Rhododendron griersonianum]